MTRRPALLLTGGASRRLGTDKATIVWRGDTLAARAARVLTQVCAPVLEVGLGVTSLPVVREDPPGSGPLAAVLAGVRTLEANADAELDAVLVLACDMPFVEPPLLELLAAWPGPGTVIPTRDERAQYLCARYGKAWLHSAVVTGSTSFKAVPAVECELVGEAAWQTVAPRTRSTTSTPPQTGHVLSGNEGHRVTRVSDPSAAPVRRPVTAVQVLAVGADSARTRPDKLVTEEPLEMRVQGPGEPATALAVTMRTPGHDFELAAGFCRTEGLIDTPGDVETIAYCLGDEGEQLFNVVTLRLRGAVVAEIRERRFLANSACGICGKAALDELEVRCEPVGPGPVVAASVVRTLPARLGEHQRLFGETGGLHAAARFTASGEIVAVREDIGRHNALDKLIGAALLEGSLPLAAEVLLVSGRLSFELVQKAAVAGIPVLCAVSAPSSLAVAAAERFGQTVVGFLRDDRFNVYTHPERIDAAG